MEETKKKRYFELNDKAWANFIVNADFKASEWLSGKDLDEFIKLQKELFVFKKKEK